MNDLLILIAEDDADDRYLIRTAFSEKGYSDKVEFVENGVELLSYLTHRYMGENAPERHAACVILLDLNMPKKDGREVLKELKQHAVFKKIPVIVFTTTKNEIEIKRCYELGANSYVVKPLSFDGLLQVVENIRSYWLQTASIPV